MRSCDASSAWVRTGSVATGPPGRHVPGSTMGIHQALADFCLEAGEGQYIPQQKWIRDMIAGMIQSGSVMLSEIGRALDEQTDDGSPRELNHTEKRLSRNLNSDRFDDEALKARHRALVSKFTKRNDGEGIVCAVDFTDIEKKRANLDPEKGMEGVCLKWDGSEKEATPGFPVVQVEAHLPDGNQLPVVLHPFSYLEPGITKGSQTKVFLDQIAQAAPAVGSRAWWVLDRGFDNIRYFDGLDGIGLRWICRLQHAIKNQRDLFMADGRRLSVEDAALETIPRFKMDAQPGRARARHRKVIKLEIGFRKVYLSDMKNNPRPVGKARTLIVVYGFGKTPIVTLVSEYIEGKAAILEATRAYGRRWKAEEATRSAKDSRGWGVRLEDVRALTLRGIRRLVLLAALVYAFLATLRDVGGELLDFVARAVRVFSEAPDIRYRLFRGLSEVLARAWRGFRMDGPLQGKRTLPGL